MTQRIDSAHAGASSLEPPLTLRIAAALQFLVGLRLLGSGLVWATRAQETTALSAGQSGACLGGIMLFVLIPVAAGLAALVIGVLMALRAQAWTWWATLVLETGCAAVVIPTLLLHALAGRLAFANVFHAAVPASIIVLLFLPSSMRVVLRRATRAGE